MNSGIAALIKYSETFEQKLEKVVNETPNIGNALYKKRSFPLKISSVNVTKSAGRIF